MVHDNRLSALADNLSPVEWRIIEWFATNENRYHVISGKVIAATLHTTAYFCDKLVDLKILQTYFDGKEQAYKLDPSLHVAFNYILNWMEENDNSTN